MNIISMRSKSLSLAAIAVFAGILLAGCDDVAEKTSEELLKRAIEKRAAGDLRSAVIDLKTILQRDPKSADARLLLGKSYLDTGNGDAAEKEFIVAETLGAPRDEIITGKGQAWLLQGKLNEILQTFQPEENSPAAIQAAIHLTRGHALAASRNFTEAEANFQLARRAYTTDIEKERPHLKLTKPTDFIQALEGIARIAISKKDWPNAEKLVSQLLELAPNDPDILSTKGFLAQGQKRFKDAEEAYTAALAARPYFASFQVELAKAQISAKNYDSAIETLDEILKGFPKHTYSNYLRALAAYQSERYDEAKKFTEIVLKQNTQHLPSYLIAGSASYALGQMEQAAKFLQFYVNAKPDNRVARKILGATQLRLGQSSEALVTLRPLEKDAEEDIVLLKMIGSAALDSGEFLVSQRSFEKASALNPNDGSAKAGAGMALLAMGNRDSALERLEQAVLSDKATSGVEVQLVRIYFQSKQYDKVITLARQIQERSPDKPSGYTLEGMAQSALKENDAAQRLFEKALELAPDDSETIANLATVSLNKKEYSKARDLFLRALEVTPGKLNILIQLSRLENIEEKPKAAREWLEKAVEANPASAQAMTLLARTLINEGHGDKAFGIAVQANKLSPATPAILEVLGQAQLLSGREKDALLTFVQLAKLAPNSKIAQKLVIRAASTAKNVSHMKHALDSMLELDPNDLDIKMARARIAVGEKDLKLGGKLVRELKATSPESPVVAELEGNLALHEQRWDDAIDAFRQLSTALKTTRDIGRLAEVQWMAGKRDDAVETLEQWIEEYPQDQVSRFKLAIFYQQQGKLEKARDEYASFVKAVPREFRAQNNLAWVKYRLGDLKGARANAEAALKVIPNNPVIMDTLGIIMLSLGENAEALRLLRAASGRLSDDPNVGTHYAQALEANGQNDKAREQLQKILGTNASFQGREEAEALLKKLEQ